MDENKSEMSLDEVLSSIKKMMIDDEPPILELTDMVSNDGSIVKIKKDNAPENKNPDIGSFLKLIQENTDSVSPKGLSKRARDEHISRSTVCSNVPERREQSKDTSVPTPKSESTITEMIKSIMTPLIQKWLDENLHIIVKNAVESEIKKLFEKK
ncbi:MAG: DUF2497 domain-containing protein [Holosporaceae bacterium]|jgi:cell pole-organizing protein PopZ|nr:DUF2497 domain-containing protein [Holosporaceae bacterium]